MGSPWMGIDPGLTGGVALIDKTGEVRLFDTPIVTVTDGKKKRHLYDRAGMATIVRSLAAQNPGLKGVVESVHSMPKQGVASSFSFGQGFGIWLGILAALEIPHSLVDPRRWTKALLADKPKGDEAAVIRCGELYPAISGDLRTPRGALLLGRADALLLAEYGRMTEGG